MYIFILLPLIEPINVIFNFLASSTDKFVGVDLDIIIGILALAIFERISNENLLLNIEKEGKVIYKRK